MTPATTIHTHKQHPEKPTTHARHTKSTTHETTHNQQLASSSRKTTDSCSGSVFETRARLRPRLVSTDTTALTRALVGACAHRTPRAPACLLFTHELRHMRMATLALSCVYPYFLYVPVILTRNISIRPPSARGYTHRSSTRARARLRASTGSRARASVRDPALFILSGERSTGVLSAYWFHDRQYMYDYHGAYNNAQPVYMCLSCV